MVYEYRVFNGETVHLDGNQFIHCRFVDCTIRYSGGPLTVAECGFESSVQLALAGSAESTAALLRSLLRFPAGQLAVASVLGIKVPSVATH